MAENETLHRDASELRLQADKMAHAEVALRPENIDHFQPEEVGRILHELRVHQIELETQNEELRCTQAALASSKASYVHLYDFAPVGYCTVTAQGLIREANLTAACLLAVEKRVLVGARFSRFIVPGDQHVYFRLRSQLLAGEGTHVCELRLVRKDASPFWALLEATAAQDAEGMPVFHVVMCDITERKAKEEELARSQAELKTVYDHAPVMMCVVDAERRMLFANPAFMAFTGASEDDLKRGQVPGPLGCVNARDDAGGCGYGNNCRTCPLRLALEDTFRTGRGQYNIEQRATLLRDGAERAVTLLGSIAAVAGAGSRQVLLCLTDITERKQSEDERAALRTQLVQAEKMAALGRLAAGVAHDFNNLLTVINGNSDLALQQLQSGDPQFAPFSEILSAGERAADLVRQLLAFTRKQVLRPELLSVNATVTTLEQMLRRVIGDNINIVISLDPDIPAVLVDRPQFEQVVMNLAVNARDAMPYGGTLKMQTGQRYLGEVCATCQAGTRPGRYVEFTVRDTGTGIDRDTLAQIFEPFFSTKGVGKGTGLGLSMVQGIVIQSGGHIEVESEVGKGSLFRLYLPAAECPPVEPKPPRHIEAQGGTETVLLVEDKSQVRRLVAEVLKRYGYSVVEAVDPEQALRLCASSQPVDLLVTDIMMPNMMGTELAKRIQLMLPGLRTLFISGYSEDTHEGKWELPADGKFLQKPFSPEVLAKKVREVLGPPYQAGIAPVPGQV